MHNITEIQGSGPCYWMPTLLLLKLMGALPINSVATATKSRIDDILDSIQLMVQTKLLPKPRMFCLHSTDLILAQVKQER